MNVVELHERALDQAGTIVAGGGTDQLTTPTPCAGWDVRALLEHLVGGNWRSVAVAEGKPVERGSAARGSVGDDPAGAYRASAEALKQAWRAPGRLEQLYELPFGRLPGQAALGMHLLETVAHGWDLARATGQVPAFDPAVVQAATEFAQRSLSGERPAGTPFAPAVTPPEDVPAIDRLAAFLGRQA